MPLLLSSGVILLLVMLVSGIVAFAPKSAFEPFRRLAGYVTRCPFKSALAAALRMLGPVRDAVTKGTNGTDRASGDAPVLRDAGEPGDGGSADAPLRFTAICPGSNSVSLALAWATNFSPARAWLELHWETNLLSAGWNPLVARENAMGETNAAFEVSVSNIPPPAAFYRAYVDTLEISIGGCGAYMREDGTRLHVATRTGSFPVSLSRPDRPAGLSAPDPVFAANPFAYT
ncbi:MAG: hypothetical protein IJI35_18300 [Kiritimatiellae bacterium]|nr:hypothetical protein [Kiritimatiellia bacterium]